MILVVVGLRAWTPDRPDGLSTETAGRSARESAAQGRTRAARLYCQFSDFMHARVVVSFDFAVSARAATDLVFSERQVVEADSEVRPSADDATAPKWKFGDEDGTPSIRSPDGEIQIVLYGLKPDAQRSVWLEAGLRSIKYRNLEGKCRQDNFAELAKGHAW